ncbi:ParB/RepB/Spo0J family partition protein [Williamsia serinedens]|uniref:Chromosome partitioning protein, ParB family n=1 Tax=Williamsia serinedens TaxID=391736 RepID=A0ABT1H717_9NOCA|nr:ParB N-terminal domain-containing protein [Williamsia serinedens]MCP2163034.1 chromosome partitioning protein, ParB family [Williamsia serinedens]
MGNNQNTTPAAATTEAIIEHVDPATLVVDTNVRTEASVDRAFVASIKERGVIQPVLATRDSEGTLHVRDGQRRTLAAREAELTSIPVYVIATDAAGDEAEVERITDQLIANEHRADLTSTQRVQAAQQLIALNVSRTKIGKVTRLGSTKAVDAAVAVAGSEAGINGLAWGLTIEQAAILAEYEDAGDTEAVEALTAAAGEGRFDHKAAQLAATAGDRAAIRAAAAPLIEAGYTILESRPWGYGSEYTPLSRLVHIETGEDVTDDQVSSLTREYLAADVDVEEVWTDAEGLPVDESRIDWSLDEDSDPADTPREGCLDPRTLTEGVAAVVTWFHTNPAEDGLETASARWNRQHNQDATLAAATEAGAVTETGEIDHEALAAAQKEKEAAERRQVKALNKAGLAAQEVRREHVRTLLARKTLPKGSGAAVARFTTELMWRFYDQLGLTRQDADTRKIAADLLGGDPLALGEGASTERAQVIALAVVCAAHEANLPKDAWRGGHEYNRNVAAARVAYLRFLADVTGYTLADVEKVVTGDLTADQIDLTA